MKAGTSARAWRLVGWSAIALLLLGAGTAGGAEVPLPGRPGTASRPDPALFEVRQQCEEIAAFFPVDSTLARRWVPPAFHLAVDSLGRAVGALVLMESPRRYSVATPNARPPRAPVEAAPGSVVHLWFMLRGPDEVLAVPGADVTSPTQYAYAVADLVTSPAVARIYRAAGKNAVRILSAKIEDRGGTQEGAIAFADGSRILVEATEAPGSPAKPLRLGGNVWNWCAGGRRGGGGDVNTTRVQFVGIPVGPPNRARVTIHADHGTPFERYFGSARVVASRGTFFRPNNVANNSSRGALAWTVHPPDTLPSPPALP